jgi:hypothetical protein
VTPDQQRCPKIVRKVDKYFQSIKAKDPTSFCDIVNRCCVVGVVEVMEVVEVVRGRRNVGRRNVGRWEKARKFTWPSRARVLISIHHRKSQVALLKIQASHILRS